MKKAGPSARLFLGKYCFAVLQKSERKEMYRILGGLSSYSPPAPTRLGLAG